MTDLNFKATTPEELTVLKHLTPMVSETLADKINNGVYIEKDGKRLLNKKRPFHLYGLCRRTG